MQRYDMQSHPQAGARGQALGEVLGKVLGLLGVAAIFTAVGALASPALGRPRLHLAFLQTAIAAGGAVLFTAFPVFDLKRVVRAGQVSQGGAILMVASALVDRLEAARGTVVIAALSNRPFFAERLARQGLVDAARIALVARLGRGLPMWRLGGGD